MSSRLANLLLLFAGAIWGMGFIAQHTAMQSMGPMAFVGLRFLLAGISVAPLAWVELKHSKTGFIRRHLMGFVLVGSLFFLAMGLQQIGLLETTVTNAGFLTALYVVLVPIVLIVFMRKRQPAIVWPASLTAIAGIYLLGGGELSGLTRGDWFIVACALFTALHVIYTERVGRESTLPVCMATGQFFICGLAGLAAHYLSGWTAYPEVPLSVDAVRGALMELIYAGIFSGGIAFTLQAVGQRYTHAAMAAVLLSSESLFAAKLGAIILADRLSWSGYMGCGLIFVAILVVQLFGEWKKPATQG